MSWDFSTTPVEHAKLKKPTAYIVVDSTKVDETKLAALEAILYGTAGTGEDGTGAVAAKLPTIDEIISTLGTAAAE